YSTLFRSSPRPHARKDQIAGQLEEKISGKKYSRAKAVNFLAQPQLLQHFQLGKTDVDTVQISDDVKDKKKRDQAQSDFGDYRRSGVLLNGGWSWNEIRRGKHPLRGRSYFAPCGYSCC